MNLQTLYSFSQFQEIISLNKNIIMEFSPTDVNNFEPFIDMSPVQVYFTTPRRQILMK
jgi:hypothetical protein